MEELPAVGRRRLVQQHGPRGAAGLFATTVVVPVDRLQGLPDGVEPYDAAAVLHPAATAYLGLFRQARIEPGDTVVVGGGGGGVGSAAVQLHVVDRFTV